MKRREEVWKSEGKRGERWKYRFQIDGIRYAGTIKSARTKADAVRAVVQIKERIFKGEYHRPARAPQLRKFVQEIYLPWARLNKRSAEDDERIVEMILHHFGNPRLSEITPKLVRDFQTARRASLTRNETTRANATVNRELSVLSRIFTLAIEEELLSPELHPCRAVRQLRPRSHVIRSLSEEEERRLLPFLSGERAHLLPVVLVGIHTGMRAGEMLTLRRGQLQLEGQKSFVDLTKTKTDLARRIPLNRVALDALLPLCEGKTDEEFIFTSPHPKHQGERLKEIKRGFKKACDLAGVKNFRVHDLRHTFGTRLAEAGVPLHQIAELMGHKDIRTTMKYVHAAQTSKQAAVDLLVRGMSETDEKKVAQKWLKMQKPPGGSFASD